MRELVGWIRDDGDEHHDFRYANATEKRGNIPDPTGYEPVYVIEGCGPCRAEVHDDCHRYTGGDCGCTCTLGLRFFAGRT